MENYVKEFRSPVLLNFKNRASAKDVKYLTDQADEFGGRIDFVVGVGMFLVFTFTDKAKAANFKDRALMYIDMLEGEHL